MARHRTYSLEFKRLVAQQYLSGEFALAALARQHDMCRSLIRIWVAKYEAGEFDDESVQGDILARYEARSQRYKVARLTPTARSAGFGILGYEGQLPSSGVLLIVSFRHSQPEDPRSLLRAHRLKRI